MNKRNLIKYIKGQADTSLTESILDWLEKSSANLEYFIKLKNLYTASNLPNSKALDKDWLNCKQIMENKGLIKKDFSKIRRLSNFITKIAAVLFIPLLAFSLYLYFYKSELKINNKLVTYYANSGIKSRLVLDDGTQVWINSDSHIKVPAEFDSDKRVIYLFGEAFFNVAKDVSKPFIVKTSKMVSVEVKGTSFNVSSYNDDNFVYVTLVDGSVDFLINNEYSPNTQRINMVPNELLSYNAISGKYVKTSVDPYISTSWKEGWLCFDNTTLREVSRKLSRWYGVNVIIKSPSLNNLSLTAKFSSEPISQVMELIKGSININYSIVDSNVIIY